MFDLGGVLIDWDPRHLYRKLFDGDEPAMEVFLRDVCSPEWNARQDAGRPWPEGVAELVMRHPESRDLIEAFNTRWDEMLAGPIEGTVDILARLHAAGVPVYALSNWSAAKFLIARTRFHFLAWFRDIVISGDFGSNKPDPAIFHLLLKRNGLVPETTAFVDDSPANVAAAQGLGLIAFRFTGPAALHRQLAALRLPGLKASDRG